MPNFSQATLAGHIGRDAETRSTPGGKSVTSFSLAVSTGYGERKQTSWYNVKLWNKEKLSEFLTKGKPVLVSGELSVREYDRNDGTKGTSVDLNANSITFLGGQREESGEPERKPARPVGKPIPVENCPSGGQWGGVEDDDVPF